MTKKARSSAKPKVNDKQYWKKRHSSVNDLKASGLQSVGLRANHYIYEILVGQYNKLLEGLGMDDIQSILDCGYGDGYFLKFFNKKYPTKYIAGIDISPAAKKKIDFINKSRLHVGDLANFDLKRKFDLVHCFDVLYHILGASDYKNSLENIANHSKKYVVLHERFLDKAAFVSSSHVRMRRSEVTNQTLNSRGFFYFAEIPTHFFAMRPLTFKLNKLMPKTMYKIDRHIADSWPDRLQERLASHSIRIYKKAV